MKSAQVTKIAFTVFGTLIIAQYLSFEICAVVGVLVFIGAIFFTAILRKKESLLPTILFSSALALGLICAFYNLNVKDVKALNGSTHIVEAHLLDEPEYTDEKVVYKMKADKLSGSDLSGFKFMVVSYADLGFCEFDKVTAEMTFYNTGLEDFYGENIYICANISTKSKPIIEQGDGGVYRYAVAARQAVRNTVSRYLNGDEGALITSMLIGDRSGLSDSAYSAVKGSGISHITVVSGLHLSILSWLIISVFRRLVRSRRIAAFVTIPFIFGLMALAGFTPSVIRAGITSMICFCGNAVYKRVYPLNSLGLAVLLQCIFNPFSVCSVSFLLTVFSTLGIILIEPKLRKWVMKLSICRFKLVRDLLLIALVTISAQLMSLPIAIITFGYVNPLAVITNVMTSTAVTLAVCFAAFGVLLCLNGALSFIGEVLLFISAICAKFILFVAEIMNKISFSQVDMSGRSTMLLCALISAVILLFFFVNSRRRIKIIALSAALAIELIVILPSFVLPSPVSLRVYGSESGSAVLICDGGRNILVGSADASYVAKRIANDIKGDGINKLDLIVLPSDCDKLSKGATTLLKHISTDQIMYSDQRIDLMTLDGVDRIGYANCEVELTDKVDLSVTDDGIILTVAKTRIFIPTEYTSSPKADIIIAPSEFIATTCDAKCVIMMGEETETANKANLLTMGGVQPYSLSNGKNAEIAVTDRGYNIEYENLY